MKKIITLLIMVLTFFTAICEAKIVVSVYNENDTVAYKSKKNSQWSDFSYTYQFIKIVDLDNNSSYRLIVSYRDRSNHEKLMARQGTLVIDGTEYTINKLLSPNVNYTEDPIFGQAKATYSIPKDVVNKISSCQNMAIKISLPGRSYPSITVKEDNLSEIKLITTLNIEEAKNVIDKK